MGTFVDKVAIVTGSSSGIGLAIAAKMISEGALVMGADLTAPDTEFAEKAKDRFKFIQTDVSRIEQVNSLVDNCVRIWGSVDLLFNNAGVGGGGPAPAAELSPEAWTRVLETNLNSVYFCCRAALPYMCANGGGAIVNVSSISGLAADYGVANYSASKAAVISFTRTVAIEYATKGVRANVICPGFVQTQMMQRVSETDLNEIFLARIPMQRSASPSEIADVAAFLASKEASYVTGATLVVDGGLMAHTGQPNMLNPFAEAGSP